MESSTISDVELDPSLESFFSGMKDEIHSKFESFSSKLNTKKEDLKQAFRTKLIEVQKMNTEIKNLQDDINQGSKDKLIERAKIIKGQVDDLIKRMDLLESYATQIKEWKLNELLKIKNDDFEIALDIKIGKSSAGNQEDDNPAGKVKSNACRQCRQILKWGNSYQSNQCNYSSSCNTHYKYSCDTCNIRYCTNCALPPNINQCGCGDNLVWLSAPYHNCDLCRNSIQESCYRCTKCDYDVCQACYQKYDKK